MSRSDQVQGRHIMLLSERTLPSARERFRAISRGLTTHGLRAIRGCVVALNATPVATAGVLSHVHPVRNNMPQASGPALLHGPYHPPAFCKGCTAFCLFRDAEVVITSWSDAPLSWPRCRAVDC